MIRTLKVTLTSGARLGPYEVQSPIGAGGMGEVYRARDTRLDRAVAIKLLPASFADRPERRQRFHIEARAISSFSTRTSARCSMSVNRTARCSSSWNTSRARRWTIA